MTNFGQGAIGLTRRLRPRMQGGWKLVRITQAMRSRAACVLTLLLLLCMLAPAFATSCLTDDHHAVVGHVHGDGTGFLDSDEDTPEKDGDDSQKAAGSCCGLSCFVAVTGDPDGVVGAPIHASSPRPVLAEDIAGVELDRINRPPITLLSL